MTSIATRRRSRELDPSAVGKPHRAGSKKEKLEKQVVRLVSVLQELGSGSAVEFQLMFSYYERLQSNGENVNLVGLLMRAKKMGRLDYSGGTSGMLFQGKHDKVKIRPT
jgi:hypothetical protein